MDNPQESDLTIVVKNLLVDLFMHLVQGLEHRSLITRESVHNQRIERLCHDVFCMCCSTFTLCSTPWRIQGF